MNLYNAEVYKMITMHKTKTISLKDVVDINDTIVQNTFIDRINKKRKVPLSSINLNESWVGVHYTQEEQQTLQGNIAIAAETKEDAIEKARIHYHLLTRNGVINESFKMKASKYMENAKSPYSQNSHERIVNDINHRLIFGVNTNLYRPNPTPEQLRESKMSFAWELIRYGVLTIDSTGNKEEFEIQKALGHLREMVKTMPLKIDEDMLVAIKATKYPHQDIFDAIEAYHTQHQIQGVK